MYPPRTNKPVQYVVWSTSIYNGKIIYTAVRKYRSGFLRSFGLFKNFAAQNGFTRLVKDTTLPGGYFVNPLDGSTCHLYPESIDPNTF